MLDLHLALLLHWQWQEFMILSGCHECASCSCNAERALMLARLCRVSWQLTPGSRGRAAFHAQIVHGEPSRNLACGGVILRCFKQSGCLSS
jgi:hypothetical protein